MGVVASTLVGKGKPTTQMVNLITGSLYESFIKKDTQTFEEFHVAFLDIFSTFNSALPGKHYDVPTHPEVEECYIKWKKADDEKKKELFIEFIKTKVGLNKPESITLITGLVTPPAAMAAKKAGERVPALKMTKAVPDVLFVPTVTFLALVSVKVSKNVLHQRMVRRDEQKVSMRKAKEQEEEENQKTGEQQNTEGQPQKL